MQSEFCHRKWIASAGLVERMTAHILRDHGLGPREWRVLAPLLEADFASPVEIAGVAGLDKVSVSRACAQFLDRGWVERHPHPRDRRSHLLTLTASGRTVASRAEAALGDMDRRLIDGVPRGDLIGLTRFIGHVARCTEHLAPSPRGSRMQTG